MGKKINVFRENDVEHLKAYLGDVVREVVFGEAKKQQPEGVIETIKDQLVAAIKPDYPEVKAKVTLENPNRGGKEKWRISIGVPDEERKDWFEKIEEIISQGKIAAINDNRTTAKGVWNWLGDLAKDGWRKSGYIGLDPEKFITSTQADQQAAQQAGKEFAGDVANIAIVEVRVVRSSEKAPNRGEIGEALLAAAIAFRFRNLDKIVQTNPEDVRKIPGLANVKAVRYWLENEPKIKRVSRHKIEYEDTITNPDNGITDTIIMNIELRGYSMDGFVKSKPGAKIELADWTKLDSGPGADPTGKVKKYFQGACNYANREAIRFALGGIPGENLTDEQKLGFFINNTDNTIMINAMGTEDQKGTKVDIEMTCSPSAKCPLGEKGPDDKDLVKMVRLSMKADSDLLAHKGATRSADALEYLEKIFGKLESVTVPDPKNPAKNIKVPTTDVDAMMSSWVEQYEKFGQDKTKRVKDDAADPVYKQLLNYIIMQFFGRAQSNAGDAAYLRGLFGKIKNAAMAETDTGLQLVQFDDKEDGNFFRHFDFSKIADRSDKIKIVSKLTGDVNTVPKLSFHWVNMPQERPEWDKDGNLLNPGEISEPSNANKLFNFRPLHRKQSPLITTEKGNGLKWLAEMGYQTAEPKFSAAPPKPVKEQTLEGKIFALLKEGLKISK